MNLLSYWRAHPVRVSVCLGGFVYALFFSLGIPLWDDDFTSWFWKIQDASALRYLWEWIWPVSTQPQYWGFNERPAQAFLYKLLYAVSGYESWSYFIFKSAVYGALCLAIFSWVMEITKNRVAATLGALVFATAPHPMASHLWHPDFATLAETCFAFLGLWIWREVEATPLGGKAFDRKAWAKKWALIVFAVYLSYKTKGDLRGIPIVLAAYVLLFRRAQWKLFALPIAAMVLLAVPWGPGILSKLPPWFPGSAGSEINWMYQPAKFSRIFDYLWGPGAVDVGTWWGATPLSLGGALGPFLLLAILGYVLVREFVFDQGFEIFPIKDREQRAVVFIALWLGVSLIVLSALPELNHTFRIRYTILPLVPASIILGVAAHSFLTFMGSRKGDERKWARTEVILAAVLVAAQMGLNLHRSIRHRRDIGQVMMAVDQVYAYIRDHRPNDFFLLHPNFRPYDYRPNAAPAFQKKVWLAKVEDVAKYPPGTWMVDWDPTLSPEFEIVEYFTGCSWGAPFDWVMPCRPATGAYLLSFLGRPDDLRRAEEWRSKGKAREARALYEAHIEKHPLNLGARFAAGMLAYGEKDFESMERHYEVVERYFPRHNGVRYNRALALEGLRRFDEAIERLEAILEEEPANYAVLFHLVTAARDAGDRDRAFEALERMEKAFPGDRTAADLRQGLHGSEAGL